VRAPPPATNGTQSTHGFPLALASLDGFNVAQAQQSHIGAYALKVPRRPCLFMTLYFKCFDCDRRVNVSYIQAYWLRMQRSLLDKLPVLLTLRSTNLRVTNFKSTSRHRQSYQRQPETDFVEVRE
jgi:hypothetical protein